jgi:hypothetical protein
MVVISGCAAAAAAAAVADGATRDDTPEPVVLLSGLTGLAGTVDVTVTFLTHRARMLLAPDTPLGFRGRVV